MVAHKKREEEDEEKVHNVVDAEVLAAEVGQDAMNIEMHGERSSTKRLDKTPARHRRPECQPRESIEDDEKEETVDYRTTPQAATLPDQKVACAHGPSDPAYGMDLPEAEVLAIEDTEFIPTAEVPEVFVDPRARSPTCLEELTEATTPETATRCCKKKRVKAMLNTWLARMKNKKKHENRDRRLEDLSSSQIFVNPTSSTRRHPPLRSHPDDDEILINRAGTFEDPATRLARLEEAHDRKELRAAQRANELFKGRPMLRCRITNREYETILNHTEASPELETGGDLWGEWDLKTGDCIIRAVTGPGPNARRFYTSFCQDENYLQATGDYLHPRGAFHIGTWHSHHILGISHPSSGDDNTSSKAMQVHQKNLFVSFIAFLEPYSGRPGVQRHLHASVEPYYYMRNFHTGYIVCSRCKFDFVENWRVPDHTNALERIRRQSDRRFRPLS